MLQIRPASSGKQEKEQFLRAHSLDEPCKAPCLDTRLSVADIKWLDEWHAPLWVSTNFRENTDDT